jgi:hypothetical protein
MHEVSSRKASVKRDVNKKTLDCQHQTQLEKLDAVHKEINSLQARIRKLDECTAKIRQQHARVGDDRLMEKVIANTDEKTDLERKIAELNENSHGAYYLKAADILFKYYDIIEKGNTTSDAPQQIKPKENSILNWFAPTAPSPQLGPVAFDSIPNVKSQSDLMTDNKASLTEKYLIRTCDNYLTLNNNPEPVCVYCNSKNVTTLPAEGCIVCNDCHSVEHIILDHEKPSYKDPPKEISYWAYKRINHFNEWLNHVQARQSTDIPEELYDKILLEIKKQRITNMADLTRARMKEILKKLNGDARKYYEHISFIIHRLNGMYMPHFPPELEDKLRCMFRDIQVPFSKAVVEVCPSRKNFLSYSFVLHKMMQLLGLHEYVHYFPLLRSREKLHTQDLIWKKICEQLAWQYIPSM